MTQLTSLHPSSLLLAVDTSPYADSATRYAAFFARRLKVPLRALHVLDSRVASAPSVIDAGMGDMTLMTPEFDAGIQDVLEERASEVKTRTEGLLRELGAETTLEQRSGLPTTEILDASGADTLVVLGKQGESTDLRGKPKLGGVAERVVRRAEGAVLLVPETFAEPNRLLLGYDGSAGAEGALEYALTLAQQLDLPLLALSVDDDLAAAQEQLAEVQARAVRDHLRLETAALSGDPVETILNAAKPGDLLAIGAFGSSRLAEFFGGSTTGELIRGASVPVLLHS